MTTAGILVGLLAAVLYTLATIQFTRLLQTSEQTKPGKREIATLGLAIVCHATNLALAPNFDLGLANALSLTAWLMIATVLALAFSQPVASLARVMAPIAAAIVVLTALFDTSTSSDLDRGIWVHALLSLYAYGLLGLAAVQACLVAWQTARLRNTHAAWPMAMPPLAALERLMFWLITTGIVALTIAIASGFVFLEDMFAQQVAHKTVFSLLAWAIFTGLLLGHHVLGWRGKTALRWTLTGMALLLVGFFGSKLVLEVVLQSN